MSSSGIPGLRAGRLRLLYREMPDAEGTTWGILYGQISLSSWVPAKRVLQYYYPFHSFTLEAVL